MGARQRGGGYRLTYARELPLTSSTPIASTSAGAASFSVGAEIQRKMHHRLACCLEDLREDQRVYEGFCVGIFCALSLVLWISLLWAVVGLGQLLEVAIRG